MPIAQRRPQDRLATDSGGAGPLEPTRLRFGFRLAFAISSTFEGPELNVLTQTAKIENGRARRKLPQFEYRPLYPDAFMLGHIGGEEMEQLLLATTAILSHGPYQVESEDIRMHTTIRISPRAQILKLPPHVQAAKNLDRMAVAMADLRLTAEAPHLRNSHLHKFLPVDTMWDEFQTYRVESYQQSFIELGLWHPPTPAGPHKDNVLPLR